MSGRPAQPVIYEVNTAVWLTELARRYSRRMTLGDPDRSLGRGGATRRGYDLADGSVGAQPRRAADSPGKPGGASCSIRRSRRRRPVWTADSVIDDVAADAVRRPDHVQRTKVGEGFPKRRLQRRGESTDAAPVAGRVETRPRRSAAPPEQDLVGPPQLADLRPQLPNRRCVPCRPARPHPSVDVGLLDPAAQRIRHDSDPRTDPFDRSVQRQRRIFGHSLGDIGRALGRHSPPTACLPAARPDHHGTHATRACGSFGARRFSAGRCAAHPPATHSPETGPPRRRTPGRDLFHEPEAHPKTAAPGSLPGHRT